MLQQRTSSTSAPKGDDARSTQKSAQSADCDHSHKHPSDHSHSHSIFHSHSHGDHDHAHDAEQMINVFEGKGASSFVGCYALAQHVMQATEVVE